MANFGTSQRGMYFRVKDGAITITIQEAQKDEYQEMMQNASYVRHFVNTKGVPCIDICFNWFEASNLIGIKYSESTYNNSIIKDWQIIFMGDNNQRLILTLGWDSSHAQTFFNSIASIDGPIGTIRITPWKKDEKTRISLRHNGEKLNWKYAPEEIPKLDTVKTAGGQEFIDPKTNKPVFDSTEKMKFFTALVAVLNKKLGYDPTREAAPAEQQPMAQPNYAQAQAPVYNAPTNGNGYAKPGNNQPMQTPPPSWGGGKQVNTQPVYEPQPNYATMPTDDVPPPDFPY